MPASLRGWRAQLGYIDAAHRVHTRAKDRIRTGKGCGPGRFPSFDFGIDSAWLAASLTAATLLSCCGSSPWTAPSPAQNPRPCGTGSCTPPES
ncbi:MAG: hypothetical protein ACLPKI_20525 [Streptosporangiaceae bacterium]